MTQKYSRPIFWPLVLIAVGVLALLNTFKVISIANMGILFQFWPVLLIALGLDLLVRQRWPIAGNLIALVTVTLAVLAVVFAPQLGWIAPAGSWFGSMPFVWGGTPGSGRVITQERTVSDFNAVNFSSVGEVVIQQGERESLTIEAEDNVLPEIRTEVRDGTLHIEYAQENGWARVRPTQPIHFKLVVTNLNALNLSGAGEVTVQNLKAEEIQITLSGAGNLSLSGLEAATLICRLSGAGSVRASGKATRLEATLSGVGSYEGGDLQSEVVRTTVSGMGSATVWATDSLDARISGLGSVNYYGQPQLSQTISSLGTVHSLGDK